MFKDYLSVRTPVSVVNKRLELGNDPQRLFMQCEVIMAWLETLLGLYTFKVLYCHKGSLRLRQRSSYNIEVSAVTLVDALIGLHQKDFGAMFFKSFWFG